MTLPALVAQWARAVDECARASARSAARAASHASDPGTSAERGLSADQRADDLRLEVAVRHAIAERLRARSTTAETREMLGELDDEFRSATQESESCLFGDAMATANGWTPRREWYFWRRPRREH